jgi:acetyl esterase/lipase
MLHHRPSFLLPTCLLALAGLLVPRTAHADDAPKTYEVKTEKNIAYYDGDDADEVKHKLDLYLPKDLKSFPVLFFVHGGAWIHGDKNFFGLYSRLAERFARHGIGVVVTNYRLTPKVMHPGHIKDVARAFAWTCKNIGKYGGNTEQLFVCGHSAGGHLVALLATDDSYLKAEDVKPTAIKGVIPVSGVLEVSDQLFPAVFGKDPKVCKAASPLSHVREGLPPFLVLYADSDFPVCATTSKEFYDALKEKKCEAEALELKNRNHMSILTKVRDKDDPAGEAIEKFIRKRTGS